MPTGADHRLHYVEPERREIGASFGCILALSQIRREARIAHGSHAAKHAALDLRWYRALVDSMTWHSLDLETQTRRGPGPTRANYVLREDNPEWRDPELLLVGDSKGVFDNVRKNSWETTVCPPPSSR